MKIYVICFDVCNLAYSQAFLSREKALERLLIIQEKRDEEAAEYNIKSNSHWLSVEELDIEE